MAQRGLAASFVVRQSLTRTVLRVGFHRETYLNPLYLLARFPLGVAYFTVLVAGLVLGFGLLPVVVGLPILISVLVFSGHVGVVGATLLDRLLGQDISYDPVAPGNLSAPAYLRAIVTDPRTYVLAAFRLASFVALLIGVTLVVSIGVTLLAVLPYWVTGVQYGLPRTVDLGVAVIDVGALTGSIVNTLPKPIIASVLVAATCLVGLHVTNLLTCLVAGLCERLLCTPPE